MRVCSASSATTHRSRSPVAPDARDSLLVTCSKKTHNNNKQTQQTHKTTDYAAPFRGHERLRSPMRNGDIAAATALCEHYAAAYNRVGE